MYGAGRQKSRIYSCIGCSYLGLNTRPCPCLDGICSLMLYCICLLIGTVHIRESHAENYDDNFYLSGQEVAGGLD